jgi:excisionase family DNA binding protein
MDRGRGMPCEICGCPDAKWLRVSTVAQNFKMSTKKVRRLIKRGEIEAVRFGGEWRIDHDFLDRYVREEIVREV